MSRTRLLRAGLPVMVAAALLLPLAAVSAEAEAPVKTGWWNAASGAGSALPDPLTPPGALVVRQGSSGPLAFAALAYAPMGRDTTRAVLVLTPAPGSTVGTVDLTACPAANSRWKSGGNQPYDSAPAPDCAGGKSVNGTITGNTVVFALTMSQQSAGGHNLVIFPSPGSPPFSVQIQQPGGNSLTPDGVPAEPAVNLLTTPAADPPSRSESTGRIGPLAAAPSYGLGIERTPLGDAPLMPLTAAAPTVAANPGSPSEGRPGSAAPMTSLAGPVLLEDPRTRTVAMLLLGLVLATVLRAAGRPAPARRLLGGLGRSGVAAEGVPIVLSRVGDVRLRGLGRFAAVRTAPPRTLL